MASFSASATSSAAAPVARTAPPAPLRRRAEGGHASKQRLDQRLHLGLLYIDLALVAAKLQMYRTGATRHGDAESLPHHVGDAVERIDRGVELGHRVAGR